MSNTMTAAHEPTIHYLDSVLNEEENRCEYSHQWRNFSISRSGRFRSKNKKRDAVDGKLFDVNSSSGSSKEIDKISARNTSNSGSSKPSANGTSGSSTTTGTSTRSQRDKAESYKSFYETNL
ncbi:hypothetical protein KR074_000609 [Drosophila pseudoananassae]|nr:hypothetical protein KR074_000609 [Drosophila pseudoananassae]